MLLFPFTFFYILLIASRRRCWAFSATRHRKRREIRHVRYRSYRGLLFRFMPAITIWMALSVSRMQILEFT